MILATGAVPRRSRNEKFSHPKSCSKVSNLLTTLELFYSFILNTNRGSLHTRGFRRIHFSVFKYRLTKNGFYGPEKIPGLSRNGPQVVHNTVTENASCLLHLALRLELTHKFGLAMDFFAPNKWHKATLCKGSLISSRHDQDFFGWEWGLAWLLIFLVLEFLDQLFSRTVLHIIPVPSNVSYRKPPEFKSPCGDMLEEVW